MSESSFLTFSVIHFNSNFPDNLDQATISPSRNGPTYDAAYLQELKKSTPSSRAPPQTSVDPYDADMSMSTDVAMDLGDVSMLDVVDITGTSMTHQEFTAHIHSPYRGIRYTDTHGICN